MPILNFVMSRPWSTAGIFILTLIVGFMIYMSSATPRLDRDWTENLAVMPKVTINGDDFALDPVMDWTYTADSIATKDSISFAAKISDVKNIWLMVEPQPGQPYAAHTLLLFEFPDDRIVGLTVEARLEKDETYDAVEGMLNKYELAYMWNTAREVLERRAVYLDKDIYIYPLTLSGEQKQAFLRGLLERSVDIQIHPRFYNTLFSNCTNELAKTAGLAWHPSWILTGYSPQRLYDLKMIPGQTFAAARDLAFIRDQLRSWNELPSRDFDRTLLAELHRRHGQ
ncbi:MAG TPA: DUF4105 domain-containing protein [Hyphomonadaceae bacterium]|nr:DUF4105 domain-containing protein [Hyphomonadaceae bacterium]